MLVESSEYYMMNVVVFRLVRKAYEQKKSACYFRQLISHRTINEQILERRHNNKARWLLEGSAMRCGYKH